MRGVSRATPIWRCLLDHHHRLGAPFVHHRFDSGTRSRNRVYPVKPVDLQRVQALGDLPKATGRGARRLCLSHALQGNCSASLSNHRCVPVSTGALVTTIPMGVPDDRSFSILDLLVLSHVWYGVHASRILVIVDCLRLHPQVHELGLLGSLTHRGQKSGERPTRSSSHQICHRD